MSSLLWPGVGCTLAPEASHIREVAERLRVARKTGHAMAQDDEVPSLKIRAQGRIHEVDLDAGTTAQRRATRPTGT